MGREELSEKKACPSADLALVDESFVFRVLRDVVDRHVRAVPVNGDHPEGGPDGGADGGDDAELEGRMEAFWDLCADPDTAAFVVRHRGVSVLREAVDRSNAEGRCAEISLGTLANISAHRGVVRGLPPEDSASLASAVLLGAQSRDGLVVVQALRLMCCLLCGQAAGNCSELWSEQSVVCVLFVLENSLRWEALKHSCDAISQGLVLEAKAEAAAEAENQVTAEPSKPRPVLCFSAAPLLAKHKLPRVLAGRILEVAAVAAGETEGFDGDAEEVLLSALCLAETLAAMALSAGELRALGLAALRVLACAERPEVLAQALEVLAELGDTQGGSAWEPSAAEAAAAFQGMGEGGAEASSISSGLVERLRLLSRASCSEAASEVAAALLQHAPEDEVLQHRRSQDEDVLSGGDASAR